MKDFNTLISLLEILLYIAGPIFIITTLYLISVVKKYNFELIDEAIKNPIIPNLDLGFFKKLQDEYLLLKKNKFPALANRYSFFILIISFLSLFLLVIFQEMMRY